MAHNNNSGGVLAVCIILSIIGFLMFVATSDRNGQGGHGFVVVPR
jgi:hypothetical protein